MSNFIDHWLNYSQIKEATRAKKLKKQGKISPEDYAKAERTLEQTLSRYVTDDPEKMYYITFISDMASAKEISDDDTPPPAPGEVDIRKKGRKKSPPQSKVGINPQSRYDTPNGIYCYPLTTEMFKSLLDGAIGGHGFAQTQDFIGLFKPKNVDRVLFVKPEEEVTLDSTGNYVMIPTLQVATEGPDAQKLKEAVYKLLSKDSQMRKRVRNTDVEDYKKGKEFVRKVEAEFLLKEIQKLGLNSYNMNKIHSDIFEEGQGEILEALESSKLSDSEKNTIKKIVERFSGAEQDFFMGTGISSDSGIIMANMLSEVIERNDKAMNALGSSNYGGVNVLLFESYYNLLNEFKREAENNIGNMIFKERYDTVPVEWAGGYNDVGYLSYLIKYCLLTSFRQLFQDMSYMYSEDLVKICRRKYYELDDFVSAITFERSVGASQVAKILGFLFNTLTDAAVKVRNAKNEVAPEEQAEYENLQSILLFYRKVIHPSRINKTIEDILRDASRSFSRGDTLYVNALKNLSDNLSVDLRADENLKPLYGPKIESGELTNGLFRELYSLSLDTNLASKIISLLEASYKPVMKESKFSREERNIAMLIATKGEPKSIMKHFMSTGWMKEEYDSLANKLYNPSAEELIESSVIQEVFREARQKSATGFLWNFTRHIAGLSSSRIVKQPSAPKNPDFPNDIDFETKSVAFKKVPALWNAVLRFIGYDGVSDLQDSGIIHPAEKTQAVFFNGSYIDVVNIFKNDLKSGSVKQSTVEFQQYLKLTAIASSVNHYAGKEVITKSGKNYYFPDQGFEHDFEYFTDDYLSVSSIDSKYVSVYSGLNGLTSYDQIGTFMKNKDLANLYIIYRLGRFGIFNKYHEFTDDLISRTGKFRNYNGSQAASIDLYYLLVGYLMGGGNFQHEPDETREMPKGIDLESLRDEVNYFLIPAAIIKAIAKNGFRLPDHIYSEDDIIAGKIKTDQLYTIKHGQWNINTLSKQTFEALVRSILKDSLSDYTARLELQKPQIIMKAVKEIMSATGSNKSDSDIFSLDSSARILLTLYSQIPSVPTMDSPDVANFDSQEWSRQFKKTTEWEKKIVLMIYNSVVNKITKETPIKRRKDPTTGLGNTYTAFKSDYGLESFTTVEEAKEHLGRIAFAYLSVAYGFNARRYLTQGFAVDSSEDMPLEEVNKLIKEMEKLLNG